MKHRAKTKVLLPLVAWLAWVSLADPSRAEDDAEARLASATGHERLALLAELAVRFRESDPEKALRYATSGERLARDLDDRAARAVLLDAAGDVHRFSNDYEAALAAYRTAHELFESVGDLSGAAGVLKDIGILRRLVGDYSSALEHYLLAHDAFERAGDRSGAASVLNSMGIVQTKLEQYEEALPHLQQAIEIQRQEGDRRGLSMALTNLGILYIRQDHPGAALDPLLESLEIKQELGNRRGLAFTYEGIGRAYRQLQRFDEALDYLTRAYALRQEFGDRKGMASTLLEKGLLHYHRHDVGRGLEEFSRALALAEEVDAPDLETQSYRLRAKSYSALGRHEEALNDFQAYERLSREEFDADNRRKINEMQIRFDSERQEKEIEILEQQQAISALELERHQAQRRFLIGGLVLLLSTLLLLYNRYRLKLEETRRRAEQARREEHERYITDLEAKNTEVEAKNAEMERFTYTVSHDLKSPLVTIQGFLGLLERDLNRGRLERGQEDIERIRSAADQMTRLLEELLELSQVGRVGSDPEPVDLVEVAREAAGLLQGSIDRSGVRLEIDPDLPPTFGDRRRLFEVFQNLIENAVKYRRRESAPRVEVGWRKVDGEAIYFVRDNGIGIEPRYHSKVFILFERLDAGSEGTGVGLALVKRIIEWHGGRIWIESAGAGHGTTVCFTVQPMSTEAAEPELASSRPASF